MAIEIPCKLDITLPSLGEREISKLYFKLKSLGDNLFCARVRLMVAREFRRRDDLSQEAGMEPITLVSGCDLADAMVFIDAARKWQLPPKSRKFVNEVADYASAMIQGVLCTLDNHVKIMAVHQKYLMKTNQVLLLPSEVCVALGCSEATLRKLVVDGSLPKPILVARKRYWLESQIQAYIQSKIDEE